LLPFDLPTRDLQRHLLIMRHARSTVLPLIFAVIAAAGGCGRPTETSGGGAAAEVVTTSAALDGTPGAWTAMPSPPPRLSTMLLLTDGSVMGQSDDDVQWYRLRPDATGSYVNGVWSQLASMHDGRLYYASAVMRDGGVFVAGGESGTPGAVRSVELYDPRADHWFRLPSFPGNDIADSTAKLLPDGRVLLLPRNFTKGVIYDPVADAWSDTGDKVGGDLNDEESVTQLRDGTFLSVDCWRSLTTQKYVPSLNQFVSAGTVPANLVSPEKEIGPGVLLYDGRALFLGGTGSTAFYTPPANPADPGAWAAGPPIPAGQVNDDGPGVVLPNGHVLFASDSRPFPAGLTDFDPVANTMVAAPLPPWTFDLQYIFENRMLLLPTGQVLMADGGGHAAIYTPAAGGDPAWAPGITSITDRGDGSYLLSGTQLNGLTEGAYYGDDAQMSTNYPLVRLVDGAGTVRYGKTYGASSNGVGPGAGTTLFRLPGVPAGDHALSVVANGIASAPATLTVSALAASCNDGVMDGDELDVDCGGSCARCADGQHCQVATDCTGPVCMRPWGSRSTAPRICQTPSCHDELHNGQETDVDCGGAHCPGCLEGKGCHEATDCAVGQGTCMFGTCEKWYCTDGTRDHDESDVDCGGPSCPVRCGQGKACSAASDCLPDYRCLSGACQAPTCTDLIRNNQETDIDCGGPNCPACAEGRRCLVTSDCGPNQGSCVAGICSNAAACGDSVRDFSESDVDCGGPSCGKCAVGKHCNAVTDCVSGASCVGGTCLVPTCSDRVRNGQETDVDCGGPTCGGCAEGRTCSVTSDCGPNQGSCVAGRCSNAAACGDSMRDFSESDVDCGGPSCAKCALGMQCNKITDCVSGTSCVGGMCRVPTCNDGVRNGQETDVDCGGPTCGGCAEHQRCHEATDCAVGQGTCSFGTCEKYYCTDGQLDHDETDVDCGGPSCPPCATGGACASGRDCVSGSCAASVCQ
jgi:hypothetical protein